MPLGAPTSRMSQRKHVGPGVGTNVRDRLAASSSVIIAHRHVDEAKRCRCAHAERMAVRHEPVDGWTPGPPVFALESGHRVGDRVRDECARRAEAYAGHRRPEHHSAAGLDVGRAGDHAAQLRAAELQGLGRPDVGDRARALAGRAGRDNSPRRVACHTVSTGGTPRRGLLAAEKLLRYETAAEWSRAAVPGDWVALVEGACFTAPKWRGCRRCGPGSPTPSRSAGPRRLCAGIGSVRSGV